MSSLVRWPAPQPVIDPGVGPSRLVTVPTYPGLIQRRPLAANTAVSGAAGVTTLSVTPTGQVENDWMLAFVSSVGGANTISSASGWTEVGTQVTQATTTVGSLWKKKAGASEAGPYQWDGTASLRMAIIVVAYLGADPTDVVDAGQVSSEGATAQQLDHNSLTPGAARNWHILATCSNSTAPDDGAVTFTQPAAYGEQAEVASGHATNANVHMALADRELLDTSATGIQSVTIAGGVNRALVGFEVVIRVPAEGGAVALDGIGAAAASATGSASVDRPLATSSNAAASASASASVDRPLESSGSAAASAIGALAATRALASTAPAAVDLDGDAVVARGLAAAGNAAAGATGSLIADRPLQATATAAAGANGALEVARPLAGVGPAASGATADLSIQGQVQLAGAASAAASATAAANLALALVAGSPAAAGATGTLTAALALTAISNAATSATGEIGRGRAVAGVATVAASATGDLTTSAIPAPRWVEGATAGTGLTEGAASGSGQIEGVLVGIGVVEGSASI